MYSKLDVKSIKTIFKNNRNFKIILKRKYVLFYFTVEIFIRLNDYRMESMILSHYFMIVLLRFHCLEHT